MRRLLFIAALIGLIPLGGYAKGTTWKTKHTTHRGTAYHKSKKKVKYKKVVRVAPTPAPAPSPVCFGYRQHNISVAECPGVFYSRDNASAYEYSVEGTYMGYYPVRPTAPVQPGMQEAPAPAPIAPQSINISHGRGIAPESGNFCTGCTSQ